MMDTLLLLLRILAASHPGVNRSTCRQNAWWEQGRTTQSSTGRGISRSGLDGYSQRPTTAAGPRSGRTICGKATPHWLRKARRWPTIRFYLLENRLEGR